MAQRAQLAQREAILKNAILNLEITGDWDIASFSALINQLVVLGHPTVLL